MKQLLSFILMIAMVSQSCQWFQTWYNRLNNSPTTNKEPLARVGDKYLYKQDIKKLIPQNMSGRDSVQLLQNYIDNWVKENLVIRLAKKNLSRQQKDIEQQVKDYRKSLLTHAYEQALIREKMDTSISNQQIHSYYQENKSNFALQNNIVQLRYLQIAKGAPKLDSARMWMRSSSHPTPSSLQRYSSRYATNFSLQENKWYRYELLTNKLPLPDNGSAFLQQNTYLEREDSAYVYLIKIDDYALEGDVAPLSYIKTEIKKSIINSRKQAFIEEMYQNIYQKALKEKRFEVYL